MKYSQRGFSILQVGFGLVALAAAATVAVQITSGYLRDAKAENAYDAYNDLNGALESYLKDNWREMMENKTLPGIANVWAPSIAELRKAGYLDRPSVSYPEIGNLTFSFMKEPSGCNLKAGHCNFAYIIKPERGFLSESLAAAVMSKLGDRGLINDPNNPKIARTWAGRIQIQSPLPVKNAIFVRGIYMASKQGNFAVANGSRPLTGEWNVGNRTITGVDVWETKQIVFRTRVVEGTPCTNSPGYRLFAMGTNKYLQYCKKTGSSGQNGIWTHAGEDVTINYTRYIKKLYVGTDGSVKDKDGTTKGYLSADGKFYEGAKPTNGECPGCNNVGTPAAYDPAKEPPKNIVLAVVQNPIAIPNPVYVSNPVSVSNPVNTSPSGDNTDYDNRTDDRADGNQKGFLGTDGKLYEGTRETSSECHGCEKGGTTEEFDAALEKSKEPQSDDPEGGNEPDEDDDSGWGWW